MTTLERQAPPSPSVRAPGAYRPDDDPSEGLRTGTFGATVAVGYSAPATKRVGIVVCAWVAVALVGSAIVCYGFGPLFQQRDQRALIGNYRTAIYDASVAVAGPGSAPVSVPVLPPTPGTPVGILEISALHLQQVVVEGVSPAQTEEAPGHVPGTSGLGQPGNCVVVGRRALFGGEFAHLDALKRGEQILVTTTQGQSVYKVVDVASTTLYPGDVLPTSASSDVTPVPLIRSSSTTAQADVLAKEPIDQLYAPTADNRLTLVTSASDAPWNSQKAVVVVAEMVGPAFAPTAQEGRSDSSTGTNGSPGELASLVLVLLGYGLVAVGAVFAYRRYSPKSAWLLTTAPLVALTVLLGEVGAQLLPAWL